MSESVITVNDLRKEYEEVTAVDGISFSVNRGEIFSLVGPNGAGKTTTVEILECLREPTSGSATVLGYNIRTDEAKIKDEIGVMPQDFNTFDRLTAKENLKLISDIYNRGDVDEIIERVGLEEFKDKKFDELSGGMKRRVGIGMSLISDPDILFLDEPTSGLDPRARRDTWNLIKDLKNMGKTVFLTTHYMEEVEELSDRAAVLINGKIEVVGSINSLIDKYGGGSRITVKKEAGPVLKEYAEKTIRPKDGYLTAIIDDKKKARQAIVALYEKDHEVEVDEAGMDEVFLNIIGGEIDERGELV